MAFIPPHFSFLPLTPGLETKLAAYLFACALIVWGADSYRKLAQRLQNEEKLRKLAVNELAHRLKNKLATIQSIISFQLRGEPRVRDAILERLSALSSTDDLIMAAQGQGAQLRDILSAEFAPYDVSRVSMQGPDCRLSPTLALTMALLVHELATNAAKSLSDARLNLDWRESGGPLVTSPNHRGFGTRLLSGSLDQFGGTIDMFFETTGLICKLSLVLPESTPSVVPNIAKVLAAD